MDLTDHLGALRTQGELLAEAAARTDLDAPVPTCPGWTVRDLVRHVGDVHRWAAAHVAERRTEQIRRVEEIAGPLPGDEDLVAWFRDGHARLVRTLETAEPDVACWSFLPAPSPLAFWARRQAHETGIHRADAESPRGAITPFEAALAVDGVDELLFGFLGRAPADADRAARTIALRAIDTGDEWLVRIGDDAIHAERGTGSAPEPDVAVACSASDLHLLLWNRIPPDAVDVRGDASVMTSWRDAVQIHWGRPRAPADQAGAVG